MRRCGFMTAASPPTPRRSIARLKNAAAEGLDAADYPVPEFGTFTSADALAAGDIKLTHSVLTFARHLAVGRIAPTRVSAEVDYGNHTPEPADILKKIADARDVNAALRQLRSAACTASRRSRPSSPNCAAARRAPTPTNAFPAVPRSSRAPRIRACRCCASASMSASPPRRKPCGCATSTPAASSWSSCRSETTRRTNWSMTRRCSTPSSTSRRAPTSSRPA